MAAEESRFEGLMRRRGLYFLLAVGAIAGLWFVFSQRYNKDSPPKSTPAGTALGWPARTVILAPKVQFSDPFGLVADPSGTLYVADNNRIWKLAPSGEVTTLADGMLDTPSGLAIDEAGNLFVADTGNNAIRKITPQGEVTTLAGFNGPVGVAVDKKGVVYVADTYNDRIGRISPTGEVSILAGGSGPGYSDGVGEAVRFDTPCAVALTPEGNLIVADTGNNAIRLIDRSGRVSTLVRTAPEDQFQIFRRPVSLAVTQDGFVYVGTTARGRVFEISPQGEMVGLTGVDIDFPQGDNEALRLVRPYGLALSPKGSLFVADLPAHGLRMILPRSETVPPAEPAQEEPDAPKAPLPWPVGPQNSVHEIVGTVGEVRGDDQGESRDHFHAGVDVQANMGTPVRAVVAAKVGDPMANWGYGALSEGLSAGPMNYIHMRVGRLPDDKPIDPSRFIAVTDGNGKPRIRVKRGTRFAVGDVLGTVNRMYHVHLEYSPAGVKRNALELGFVGLKDRVIPHIQAIQLLDQNGQSLTAKRGGRAVVLSGAGDIGIVVDAFDQTDGNEARRRLGLYQLGYQILRADGTPVPGFEQPLITLAFDQLPPDDSSVKIAYAEGSGETVHGSAATRFLYVVTNRVREGHASVESWHAADLPRGDYVIRIFAADHAGNVAIAGRDLPVTLD